MSDPTPPVRLDEPGAGVPAIQRWVGKNILLPFYRARCPWDAGQELLRREGLGLIDLAAGRPSVRLEQRVLVPTQIGLEDSSRYWSYAMVLEHLVIIGDRTVEIVVELSHGRVPGRAVRIPELKPRGEMPAPQAVELFRRFLNRFGRRLADEVGDRASPTRFEHPWFGPLHARQWIAFLPMHQRIHALQAKRILLGAGRRTQA